MKRELEAFRSDTMTVYRPVAGKTTYGAVTRR